VISRGGQLLAFLAVALAGAGARAEQQIAFPQGGEQPLSALQDIDVIEHLGEHIPSGLTFTNVAGQPVALDALLNRGKPVVVTLGYHRCPMLCGLVLDGLAKATHGAGLELGKDFTAVDISIDPNEDPKLLLKSQHRVLELVGGGATAAEWPFWLSTTDGAAAARTLADAVGFRYKFDPRSKQFAHDAVAFVLTPEGIISRYLYGVDYPARDFRMAVVEASGGRVGTSLDKIILSCYRYDPTGRRYAPFVLGFMRIGALLVFFALAGLLTVLWRKEIAMRKRRTA
jgi:protein SCO1/2